jgi:hypothetical protein
VTLINILMPQIYLEHKLPIPGSLLKYFIPTTPTSTSGSNSSSSGSSSSAGPASQAGPAADSFDSRLILQALAAAPAVAAGAVTQQAQLLQLLPPADALTIWSAEDLLQLLATAQSKGLQPDTAWLAAAEQVLKPKLVLLQNGKLLVEGLQVRTYS